MSLFEIAIVGALLLLIGGVFWFVYRNSDETVFWNPLTMFAAVFAYYFLVGPLIALGMGTTSMYGIEFRDIMWKAWLAGTLGLASICCGFAIRTKQSHTRLVAGIGSAQRLMLLRCFYALLSLGLLGFGYDAYVSGHSLTELLFPIHVRTDADVSSMEREGLAAGNYLLLLINTFIPALCVLTVLTEKQPPLKRLLIVGLPTAQVVLFYTSLGFRHRIVILLASVIATDYLLRRKRPSPALLLPGVAGLILISGLIVITRSYGSGLDLSQMTGISLFQIFLGGLSDAGTFFTTVLVLDSFPGMFPFIGLHPLWVAITIPVPRNCWPEKPFGETLEQFAFLTGTRGQAVPIVGEHYMMAGWIGVVLGGIIVGVIYRRFWEFYRSNPRNPLVIALYAISWALVFAVVNRGYLAQTLMEFFFDFMPLVFLFWISRKYLLVRTPTHVAPSAAG